MGRYAKVADALFAQQATISATGKVEDVVKTVLTPTELKKVNSLLKDPGVQHEIEADLTEGGTIPLTGTPTLWITHAGKSQTVNWPINYDLLKSYLNALVKK